jgi:hypothetical protein
MKTTSVTVCRNDGYKDDERGLIHFLSALDTFDEVIYVDWNSPLDKGSYLYNFIDKLPITGKFKHIVIPPDVARLLTRDDPKAQKCCESIARNIGIRRAEGDWIVSTNLDIIVPKREDIITSINEMLPNTFYTISRREAPKEIIAKYKLEEWKQLREELYKSIPPRKFPARVTPNDVFSKINCCGDFQLAHRDIWNKIKGFEENMIYACYSDSNVQKKAIIEGFGLESLYYLPLFHMEHGSYFTKEDGTRVSDEAGYSGDSQAYNDPWYWIEYFQQSENDDNWGLKDIEIEIEIF